MSLLPELILHQAHAHPSRPAVITLEGTTSYRELVERAARISNALRARGVGTESVVGVLMRPGIELVATVLGVWLAGGAYLPLDPLHPPQRQRRLLAAAGAEVLLIDDASAVRAAPFESDSPVQHLSVAKCDSFPATVVEPPIHPRQAAYVVFTSGSTGEPKGVVIEHAAITNRVEWGVRALALTPVDRVLQKTPLTFDAAMWEVFAPLRCGAPVTFGTPAAGSDPQELISSVRRQAATVLQVVPSMLRLLAAEPGLAQCRSLRVICSAGEPLTAELCQQVLARLPVELWNTYGPTECAIDVTAVRFDPAVDAGPVPIGAAIDNVRCEAVHSDGTVAVAGQAAELYVGGVGVGRGYHGQPALTAERFVPDPGGPPGSRRYRTGDLVRLRPDGGFDFIGRKDAQVKINGVRIEPGEVERALLTHPAVVDAAVRAVTDPAGVRRLAAYVVPSADARIDDLTRHLRERLPSSLVPAVITDVAALPRTSSGKLDRARLPEPEWHVASRSSDPTESADAAVRLVRAVWRQLLDREEVGLDDDFFRLGGHSLMLTRLTSALSEAAGLALDLSEVYERLTVRSQAELLTNAMRAAPIPHLMAEERLPLSPAQERFWVLDRMNPGSAEYVVPLLIRLPVGTTEATVRRALARLADRHEVLRSCYPMDAEGLSVQVEKSSTVVLRVAELTDADLGAQVAQEVSVGFDLSSAPLWRSVLIQQGDAGPLLLVVCHHITCDGWSTGVLDRDLRELIAAERESRAAQLPSLSLRYVDAVAWQRRELTAQLKAEQIAYWRKVLAGIPRLRLPDTRPRPAQRDVAGAMETFALPADVAAGLIAVGRREGATPFMVLLTLWTTTLARAAGQWDFGVGTPDAGRSRPELHDLVGLFVNTLVIRPKLAPELTFSEALMRTRQVCRESLAHRQVPFEAVVDAVEPQRDASQTPLFATIFSLLADGLIGPTPDDQEVELLRRAWRVARTDLTLTMWRSVDGEFVGALEYATAIFPEPVITELVANLRELAVRFAADPSLRLGQVETVTGAAPTVAEIARG